MTPMTWMPPAAPSLQRRFLGTSGVLGAADRRSRRPASERPEVSVEDVWSQLEAYYQQHSLLNYEHCQRVLEHLQSTPAAQGVSVEQLHFLLGSCVPELLPAQSALLHLYLTLK